MLALARSTASRELKPQTRTAAQPGTHSAPDVGRGEAGAYDLTVALRLRAAHPRARDVPRSAGSRRQHSEATVWHVRPHECGRHLDHCGNTKLTSAPLSHIVCGPGRCNLEVAKGNCLATTSGVATHTHVQGGASISNATQSSYFWLMFATILCAVSIHAETKKEAINVLRTQYLNLDNCRKGNHKPIEQGSRLSSCAKMNEGCCKDVASLQQPSWINAKPRA